MANDAAPHDAPQVSEDESLAGIPTARESRGRRPKRTRGVGRRRSAERGLRTVAWTLFARASLWLVEVVAAVALSATGHREAAVTLTLLLIAASPVVDAWMAVGFIRLARHRAARASAVWATRLMVLSVALEASEVVRMVERVTARTSEALQWDMVAPYMAVTATALAFAALVLFATASRALALALHKSAHYERAASARTLVAVAGLGTVALQVAALAKLAASSGLLNVAGMCMHILEVVAVVVLARLARAVARTVAPPVFDRAIGEAFE